MRNVAGVLRCWFTAQLHGTATVHRCRRRRRSTTWTSAAARCWTSWCAARQCARAGGGWGRRSCCSCSRCFTWRLGLQLGGSWLPRCVLASAFHQHPAAPLGAPTPRASPPPHSPLPAPLPLPAGPRLPRAGPVRGAAGGGAQDEAADARRRARPAAGPEHVWCGCLCGFCAAFLRPWVVSFGCYICVGLRLGCALPPRLRARPQPLQQACALHRWASGESICCSHRQPAAAGGSSGAPRGTWQRASQLGRLRPRLLGLQCPQHSRSAALAGRLCWRGGHKIPLCVFDSGQRN